MSINEITNICLNLNRAIIYIYTVELYPTCVRASAVGLCSAGGRIGGALSPLVFGLDQTLPWFSNTFFGVCAIIAGGSTLLLPETIGQPMAQSMDEAESGYLRNSNKTASAAKVKLLTSVIPDDQL